jgi:hypothetical protein
MRTLKLSSSWLIVLQLCSLFIWGRMYASSVLEAMTSVASAAQDTNGSQCKHTHSADYQTFSAAQKTFSAATTVNCFHKDRTVS